MKRSGRLTLRRINNGDFMKQAEKDFAELRQAMMTYRKEHGEAARGSVAEMVIKIRIGIEKAGGQNDYAITTATSKKTPNRPPTLERVFSEDSMSNDAMQDMFVLYDPETEPAEEVDAHV